MEREGCDTDSESDGVGVKLALRVGGIESVPLTDSDGVSVTDGVDVKLDDGVGSSVGDVVGGTLVVSLGVGNNDAEAVGLSGTDRLRDGERLCDWDVVFVQQ